MVSVNLYMNGEANGAYFYITSFKFQTTSKQNLRNNYTLKNKVTFSVCDTLHACPSWHHRNSWGDICPLVKNNETLQLRTVLIIPERCFSVPFPFRSTHLGEMN